MKFLAIIIGIFIGLGAWTAFADPPAPVYNQPLPEQFTVSPYGNLDQYNPVSKKVRAQGAIKWTYIVNPGCSGGDTIKYSIDQAMGNIYANTGVYTLNVSDGSQDLTLYDDCGLTFANKCGGPPVIACLGDGFPYNLDIRFSQDMATFYDISEQSIVLHELFGHAFATWNEGYCTGYNQPVQGCTGQFAAIPNFVSIMNTGVDSRHLLGDQELGQWGRTQGSGRASVDGRGDGYIYLCGIPTYNGKSYDGTNAKANFLALYGLSNYGAPEQNYRYIGSIPMNNLRPDSNGCFGVNTAGYVQSNETPCYDLWNAADTAQLVFRSDRCL